MNRRFTYGILLIILLFISCNSSFKKIKYSGIDRTISLLQQSSESSPNTIEILFYGQSIIGGMKTDILIDSLRNHYPTAIINYKHKPIGGFTIPKLVKTAEHDLYHDNPDLIIFHAYGGIKNGLYDSLIHNIRSKMTSDILLLDHHYVWNTSQDKLKAINEAHERDSKAIQKIAEKYDCGFVEVRNIWKNYLDESGYEPNELIGNTIDSDVHPNDLGNELLRKIIFSKLTEEPKKIYSTADDSLRSCYKIEHKKNIRGYFDGNRFEIKTIPEYNRNAKVEVFIEDKKPSQHRSNFYISRPSRAYKNWMPSILKVTLGETLPQQEKWTLEILDIDRESKVFKFKLNGDLTGFDGEGYSNADFTSNSGRIEILSKDFNILETDEIFKNQTPEGFKITFSVLPIVQDTLVLNQNQVRYPIFRGFKSKTHKIELNIISENPKIEKIWCYEHFLKP